MAAQETTPQEADDIPTRIWLQVLHGLDEDRLLPPIDRRRRELANKLDLDMDLNGWRIYVSGQVHAMMTAKAPGRRNAERMLVEAIRRWRAQVEELLPDRMADLERIVNFGLDHPGPPPNPNSRR